MKKFSEGEEKGTSDKVKPSSHQQLTPKPKTIEKINPKSHNPTTKSIPHSNMQWELDRELLDAAEKGNLSRVKALLAKGANPSTKDNYGKSLNDMM